VKLKYIPNLANVESLLFSKRHEIPIIIVRIKSNPPRTINIKKYSSEKYIFSLPRTTINNTLPTSRDDENENMDLAEVFNSGLYLPFLDLRKATEKNASHIRYINIMANFW
jgi:hypothetical protein